MKTEERHISVADFAELCRISKSCAHRCVRQGKILAPGGLVDPQHPVNRVFLASTLSNGLKRGKLI